MIFSSHQDATFTCQLDSGTAVTCKLNLKQLFYKFCKVLILPIVEHFKLPILESMVSINLANFGIFNQKILTVLELAKQTSPQLANCLLCLYSIARKTQLWISVSGIGITIV